MNYKVLFSIFTPIYNRRDRVHRVWESLQKQSLKNFEWIIVDDGSTDNVICLLKEYKEKADFPVIILQQENKGKHFAWNRAVEIAQGELFVPADSDDSFTPDTLEFFYKTWYNLTIQERNKLSGINVLCQDPVKNTIVGDPFPKEYFFTDNLELTYKYRIKGEKWGCVRTDLLKNIPYPEIEGRRSYVLSYVWFSLAKNYKVLCINKILRNYFKEDDSITSTSKKNVRQSSYTNYHYGCWHINQNFYYVIKYSPLSALKILINTILSGFISQVNSIRIINDQKKVFIKSLTAFLLVPSWFYYLIRFKNKL